MTANAAHMQLHLAAEESPKATKPHLAPLATSPSASKSSYVLVLVRTDSLTDGLFQVRPCCGSRAHRSPQF